MTSSHVTSAWPLSAVAPSCLDAGSGELGHPPCWKPLPLPLAASPGPVTPPPPHPGPVTSRPLQHDLNKGASPIHYWTFSS